MFVEVTGGKLVGRAFDHPHPSSSWIGLTTDSTEDLQIITSNLEKAAAKVELKITQDKTKITVIQQKVSDRTSDEIKVEGKTNETVDKFKYLGMLSVQMAIAKENEEDQE